jgi:hypothetical protein
MSVDASLNLSFTVHNDAERVLKALFDSPWNSKTEEWLCVPLGCDVSEWQVIHGQKAVLEVLRAKLARHEVFGIQLFWDGTGIGGEFLIFSNERASLLATVHRVKVDQRTSDVSWYLQRFLPVLSADRQIGVEGWTWSETG